MTRRIAVLGGSDGDIQERRTRTSVTREDSAPQVEVRAVCPACGGRQYAHNGSYSERLIYRKCLDCGHTGKVEVIRNDEITGVTWR